MPKFLLIDSQSYTIPGDERSQTNPGHGYPEHEMSVPVLKWFKDEDELMGYLETWGRDIEDPLIYELNGRVRVEKKLTTSLQKQ